MFDIVFGGLLFGSAFTGASMIAYFFLYQPNHHDYWCHTDKVDPELSHGNSEPHI